MKKQIRFLLLTAFIFLMSGFTVMADEITGDTDWLVEFNADKEMVSNFSTASFADVIEGMQPGDSVTFQVTIENTYKTPTDWYMTNEVLKSLEDAGKTAVGGGYSYMLTYTDAKGSVTTLYVSDKVGGENYIVNLEGLHEATASLEEFFYLDTLETNDKGMVSLYVKLDGETQGNDYQDTFAQLQLNFAVELPTIIEDHDKTNREENRYIEKRMLITGEDQYIIDDDKVILSGDIVTVKTGDETHIALLLLLAGILGIILLLIGCAGIRLRKQIKGGGLS